MVNQDAYMLLESDIGCANLVAEIVTTQNDIMGTEILSHHFYASHAPMLDPNTPW